MTIKFFFLDASAMVKLVIKEQQCHTINDFFPANGAFHTTFLCVAETLNVLKRKWLKKELSQEDYLKSAYFLMSYVEQGLIQLSSFLLSENEVFVESKKIAEKYSLDISDALQLYTLKNGFYKKLAEESRPCLITADSNLADAARSEGLRVWDCLKELAPNLGHSQI